MDKQLVLTEEALQSMLDKAVRQDRNTLDLEAIKVAGCNVICILGYEGNIRNEDKGIIALKHWCMQNNLNHFVIFEILREYGFIDENNLLTIEGFEALNGIDPQESPVITVVNGALYVDDKDDRFDHMIKLIKSHDLFEDKSYNTKVKNRHLNYARYEMKFAEILGVEILEPKLLSE